MTEDHLDKETSFRVSLTENGIEAKAKSRTLAALDRLGGNIVEWVNTRIEVGNSRKRATLEGEAKIIAAMTEHAVKLIGTNDTFAARALASKFGDAARKQLNKDAVLQLALEDLQSDPPTQHQASTGPDMLSEEFFSRFEGYAEDASTDQLRERWARVLASEIRQPGNFSRAVMRVIDEIDPTTAACFEELCENRIGSTVPKPLVGKLDFATTRRLVEAGLLTEPGLGQRSGFTITTLEDGKVVWFMPLDKKAIAFDRSKTASSDRDSSLITDGETLAIPTYVLTSVGTAISMILEDKTEQAAQRLIETIQKEHPDLVIYTRVDDSLIYEWSSGAFPDQLVDQPH
ncbi:DUF2806 domain-containing protein [Agrobacterium cavarae]|uniref:DUF2806 domain-containing protein n=1 Tax=Agrobacterium cavarae TaxID=2528239 RepID=UPI003EE4AA85